MSTRDSVGVRSLNPKSIRPTSQTTLRVVTEVPRLSSVPPEAPLSEVPDSMASRKAKRANTLGEATEPAFDRITQLATVALRVPGAAVALSDARGLFVMSAYGLPGCDERERLLEFSFCAHVVTNGAPLVVNDARADSPEQADPSPLRPIVSFAGVPIVASSGQVIGVLCVFEHRPRAWTPDAVTALTALAHAAITEIELRSMLQTIHDSSEEIRRSYIRRR